MRVLLCESCGAPLDAPWAELVVICQFCGNHNLPGKPGGPVPPRAPVDGRPRLNLGGRTYVLEGRLGLGESSTVYRGRWVVRLGELVSIKVLTAMSDADLLRREWDTLKALQASTIDGADHFRTRLPAPVAHGLITSDRARTTSVFRWKSGFVHTLSAVKDVYEDGVPGQVQVWLLKRLLELLGWVHRAGFVHGAVHPDHVLVHPKDHGANLIGWTAATPWAPGRSRPLPARSRTWKDLYVGTDATPANDIAMACKSVEHIGLAGGWSWSDLVRTPPVKAVIDRGKSGRVEDAWQLRDELVDASRETFGPPAYHPLAMPGWTG